MAVVSPVATVAMPGTCGELVQGVLDGDHFLVSCPIDRYAVVSVALQTCDVPDDAALSKAHRAARLALDHFGRSDLSAVVTIDSDLPRGKGFGSSTADVAGAIFAVARNFGHVIAPSEVARLALCVEPSDGSMFPGLAVFDHRRGRRLEYLGEPPPMEVAVLDFGGEVDTMTFNEVDRTELLRESEVALAEALALVRRGVRERRADLIGRGATISAWANQRVLYKPQLAVVDDLARQLGAFGVCIGHSGTVIGVITKAGLGVAAEVAQVATAELPGLQMAVAHRIIGGGCR